MMDKEKVKGIDWRHGRFILPIDEDVKDTQFNQTLHQYKNGAVVPILELDPFEAELVRVHVQTPNAHGNSSRGDYLYSVLFWHEELGYLRWYDTGKKVNTNVVAWQLAKVDFWETALVKVIEAEPLEFKFGGDKVNIYIPPAFEVIREMPTNESMIRKVKMLDVYSDNQDIKKVLEDYCAVLNYLTEMGMPLPNRKINKQVATHELFEKINLEEI